MQAARQAASGRGSQPGEVRVDADTYPSAPGFAHHVAKCGMQQGLSQALQVEVLEGGQFVQQTQEVVNGQEGRRRSGGANGEKAHGAAQVALTHWFYLGKSGEGKGEGLRHRRFSWIEYAHAVSRGDSAPLK
jgi:hypothetical protein